MRFDLHYDDGPNGPRWQPIGIAVVVAATVIGWALIQAVYGR